MVLPGVRIPDGPRAPHAGAHASARKPQGKAVCIPCYKKAVYARLTELAVSSLMGRGAFVGDTVVVTDLGPHQTALG